jgi:hypothetical protein
MHWFLKFILEMKHVEFFCLQQKKITLRILACNCYRAWFFTPNQWKFCRYPNKARKEPRICNGTKSAWKGIRLKDPALDPTSWANVRSPCLENSLYIVHFMYRHRCKEKINVIIESKRKENSLVCYLNFVYFRAARSRKLKLAGCVMYLYIE